MELRKDVFRLAGSRPGHFLDLVLIVSESCYFGLLHLVNPTENVAMFHAWPATLFAAKHWGLPGMSHRTPEHITMYISDVSIRLGPAGVFGMLARYDRSFDIEEISLVY